MEIILLSGGSGTRLWPLSNDARSKQFLRLLPCEDSGRKESMLQRVVRQIEESQINARVTVATSITQQDAILSQLGEGVDIVTEPSRRDTYPAICLACLYLLKERKVDRDEVVVVMPCDPYTQSGYFQVIADMADCINHDIAKLALMGITPTYPSSKYGYIVPGDLLASDNVFSVKQFTEKPDVQTAERLISERALWNGGVFAFKLGYITDLVENLFEGQSFHDIREQYHKLKKISFDYEVVESANSVSVVTYDGEWKDLGTWNTLTDELPEHAYGNVTTDNTGENTHIINELDIPVMCIGTRDLIVAASPDGILVSEKSKSENIKEYADRLKRRPMFEERRWGTYKVIDYVEYPDCYCALTKHLTLHAGCSISYQEHACRDEVWTFIDGEGEVVLDGCRQPVKRGMTVHIPKGMKHALRATTSLSFIEVQSGTNLVESDIMRYPFEW